MKKLLRASTLVGRPVVTLAGESPLEIRDVVFDRSAGGLIGFTLRKHGFLGGPVREWLPWSKVHGLGPDAVVIGTTDVFDDEPDDGGGGDVLGSRVVTEDGTHLGDVVEVIISTGPDAEAVGFEIEPTEACRAGDATAVFLPLPDTIAVSDENVIVPDAARDYIADDLSGFGGAVADFRSRLREKN